jgi:hypothetical protein
VGSAVPATLAEAVAQSPAVIEYRHVDRGRRVVPFSVTLGNGRHYDFEWSRSHGTLFYSLSGAGPLDDTVELSGFAEPRKGKPVPIWIAESLRPVDHGGRPADLAALGYVRLPEPLGDPFEGADESETVYCGRCRDWLPDDGSSFVCDHVWWCNNTGWFIGPGADEGGAVCSGEHCWACRRVREERAERRRVNAYVRAARKKARRAR